MNKMINKVKLNYMSAVSKIEPVAKIPVSSSKLAKLNLCIKEKCRQNHLNDHVLENDELYYSTSEEKTIPKESFATLKKTRN